MSELKEHIFCDIDEVFPRGYCGPLPSHEARPYYLKSEVNKVIAELEMKLAAVQQVLRLNKPKTLYSNLDTMGRLNHKIDVVERRELHQKYKRCLAMARWCGDACDKWMMRKAKAIVLGKDGVEEYYRARRKLLHYMRWQNRWMKFLEKFKEAKQ